MQSGLLLVRFGHVQLHGLEVSRQPSRTGQALPAVCNAEATDGCCRTGISRPRDFNVLGKGEVIAAKELPKTLQLGGTQAMWLLSEVWNPGVRSWRQAVATERTQEHPPLREVDEGLAHRPESLFLRGWSGSGGIFPIGGTTRLMVQCLRFTGHCPPPGQGEIGQGKNTYCDHLLRLSGRPLSGGIWAGKTLIASQ